ncbi:MAG TPA: hypothetical protein VFW31_13940 [Candidatus Angelobacter sp.]|nr:hypothetical protein [Candidatus Angelobacter sp.]
MKIEKRTSRPFDTALHVAYLRAAAARLATPLVDVLLGVFSLFIRDEAPGTAIVTFRESADALASRHCAPALQSEMTSTEPHIAGAPAPLMPAQMNPYERLHGSF